MLNDKDLAALVTKLEVPMVVGAAIEHGAELQDDVHYALHDLLSEMQPDTALIAIALSAKAIAAAYCGTGSGSEIVIMECDRMISEYGMLWLENSRRGHIDNSYLISILENVPEDLECLAELIDINLCYAAFDNPAIAEICEIMQIQAGAHAIIAEEFLSVMEMAAAQKKKNQTDVPANMAAANASETLKFADNIVQFPG
ncbi:MAG: hypothetical protein CMH27_02590 [Micavibrio sp.]|nr:hypothetical protein [Micavibrio sp.]|tara:strand:+ start:1467 stop:2066 length:600 start_codon:yes stop_codon:yes gene_type:complete